MKSSDFDPEFQNRHIESRIIAALERISESFRVLLWKESKDHSLSPIQIQLLIFLLHHSPEQRGVSYLAGEFNLTKATVSDAVKSLEQKGLIRKDSGKGDNRRSVIHLTEAGKKTAMATSLFTKELRVPLNKLHPDDKENLLLSLLGMIQHLQTMGVISVQRMCFTCAHYREDGGQHFCSLLNKPLQSTEIRIDCPEHLVK